MKKKSNNKEKQKVVIGSNIPIEDLVDLFKERKKNFKLTTYAHSDILICDNVKYICVEEFDKDLLPAASKVRSNVLKIRRIPKKHPKEISFYKTGSIINKMKIGDIRKFKLSPNIDITKAYPVCLYNNGFIDEKTFKFLCKLEKVTRLKAIGCLGTFKVTADFKKGKMTGTPKIKKTSDGQYLKSVLKFVQWEIGNIMCQIASHYENKKQFLFFWTDGVYLTPQANIKYAIDILKKNGYDWEELSLRGFRIHKYKGNMHNLLQIKFKKGRKGKHKEFNIPEKPIMSQDKMW